MGVCWHTFVVVKATNAVSWVIDGIPIATVPANVVPLSTNVFVGYSDLFNGASGTPAMSFAIVENLRVETYVDAPINITSITRVGGNVEVVEEGRTGLLVPPNAPAELAEAIVQLQRDPARSRGLGLAGRRRVEEYFDVRRMVADYERLYHGAATVRRTRPRNLSGRTDRDPMVRAR